MWRNGSGATVHVGAPITVLAGHLPHEPQAANWTRLRGTEPTEPYTAARAALHALVHEAVPAPMAASRLSTREFFSYAACGRRRNKVGPISCVSPPSKVSVMSLISLFHVYAASCLLVFVSCHVFYLSLSLSPVRPATLPQRNMKKKQKVKDTDKPKHNIDRYVQGWSFPENRKENEFVCKCGRRNYCTFYPLLAYLHDCFANPKSCMPSIH